MTQLDDDRSRSREGAPAGVTRIRNATMRGRAARRPGDCPGTPLAGCHELVLSLEAVVDLVEVATDIGGIDGERADLATVRGEIATDGVEAARMAPTSPRGARAPRRVAQGRVPAH